MSILKKYETDNSLYLFIAFHNSYDDSVQASQAKLEKLMKEIFKNDERYHLMSSGEEIEDNEIIYRFQKPLMASERETLAFFTKLKLVFQMTSEMSPHFTQMTAEDKGANK